MNKYQSLLILTSLFLAGCATEFQPPDWANIPKDLDEAYVELDQIFSESEKQDLRNGETQVGDIVLTFGMQLKEYWGLWKDSKIAKYLRKRDVEHPDQMITVIFEGYVIYLREQDNN